MAKTILDDYIEEMLDDYREVEGTRRSLELLWKIEPPLRSAPRDERPHLRLPATLEAMNPARLWVNVVQGGYQAEEGRLVLIIDIEEADRNNPVLVEPLPSKMDVLFNAEPKRPLKANIPLSGLREQCVEIELREEFRSYAYWSQFDEQPLGKVELPLRFLLRR
jgi:hypothetical protein